VGEVFLDVNGFLLDVVFVLLPPLCLPQDVGEAFLDASLVLLDVVFVF